MLEDEIIDLLEKEKLLVKSIDFLVKEIEKTNNLSEDKQEKVLLNLLGRANVEYENLKDLETKLKEIKEKYNL